MLRRRKGRLRRRIAKTRVPLSHLSLCLFRPFSPFSRVLDILVVVEVLLSPPPYALARKPCKGDQNTAGGERSVTPGYQGTRERVPRELGSPRNALRQTRVVYQLLT